MVDKTLSFYEANARSFFDATVGADMSALREAFLSRLPPGAAILDAGCGSGRDAREFAERGHTVTAFDASAQLASLASRHCGVEVAVRSLAEVDEVDAYDGIWCCASLLHVPAAEMQSVLARLWRALRADGCMYVSFKLGKGEWTDGERRFTDADEEVVRAWFAPLAGVASVECWVTEDCRPDRTQKWINGLATRQADGQAYHARSSSEAKLVTGGDDPFLPHLSHALSRATDIAMAVSFIKTTGLRLLMPELLAAVTADDAVANASTNHPRRIRVLTSDYLDVTDPEALRLLRLVQERGAQIRVFVTQAGSFHLKAYLFARMRNARILEGTGFVGSSNLSRQALQNGLEWNYRIGYPGDDGFLEAWRRFDELFAHPNTVELDDGWIDRYERRRVAPLRTVAPGSQEQEPPPQPTIMQADALAALAATRSAGSRRGLVVLATGLGKTWLAAFDAVKMSAARVLFVAHREEILAQAAQTFLRIRPRSRIGFYMGQHRDIEVDVLCASVQTLGRASHLERFAPGHFDYIVVDEFHHAAAPTYRRLLAYFDPAFLLGLTATPDRTDQSDILLLCDNNLVFSRNLLEGIKAQLLAPFHYYGIADESVDYREIPWRSGRFDPEQLTNKLATLARARHALKAWRERAQKRTLAFCVSIAHADFMADQFADAGISAAAVYSGSALGRAEALERLRNGRLSVIFSVDLFNEGVDLPGIDTVMMLRPTESRILFLQQLGRGLRRSDDKPYLVILDFIGNHQSFLRKPQALFGIEPRYDAMAAFARCVEQGQLSLPDGCYVNYDLQVLDFFRSLNGAGSRKEYESLRASLGRRPTLTEFYRSGANMQTMRDQNGSWFELVGEMNDLNDAESAVAGPWRALLRQVEVTPMTKSFKMVLLEAWLELNGLVSPPLLSTLAERSWDVLHRRHVLLTDLPEAQRRLENGTDARWQRYWFSNPINAWIGGNTNGAVGPVHFEVARDRFRLLHEVAETHVETAGSLIQELVDFRLAAYEARLMEATVPDIAANDAALNVVPLQSRVQDAVDLPFFPNLKIACGHFKTGRADAEEYRPISLRYGQLNPSRHFIACASGNSMNGGKNPIQDGDYLLLELISPCKAGSITGSVVAIERQGAGGDNQYLLRVVNKTDNGRYVLKANNPKYADMLATDDMRTLARLKAVIDPQDI